MKSRNPFAIGLFLYLYPSFFKDISLSFPYPPLPSFLRAINACHLQLNGLVYPPFNL
jgi:hypothetical protein